VAASSQKREGTRVGGEIEKSVEVRRRDEQEKERETRARETMSD
jgi:hypothetical protein